MSSSSSSSKRTTTARPPSHHNQRGGGGGGGGGDHYYNDDARLHSRSSSSSSTRQHDHPEQQQQHWRGSRGPRAAVAGHHHYNRRSTSRSPSRRGRQRTGHRRGRRDYEMYYYERMKGSSSKNIITSRNNYDYTTKDTTVGMVSSDDDEDDDENAHRAAVANAAAVAIAAAKNMAKTQEKHELDRRIAVARASTTAATAAAAAGRRKANKTVLPGFTSMDDDDDDEQPEQEYPSSRGSSNGHHSGEDSAAAAGATGGAPVPPPSSSGQMPIHTTKTKQMDDFLDEIKSRHQLRHEVETLKDTLKQGTLTVAEQLRVKGRLAGLQSKLGGVTTLQESEMVGKAMRGDQHHGDYQDDEETANLYIGNLPFGVTEDMLIKEFGKYGSITSVKIMYPRTDEERSRGYVPAFIAFSSREEAQAAKEAMESGPCTFGGAMMRETILRVGWGKAMNSAQVKTAQRNKSMLVQVAQQQGGEGGVVGASNTSGGATGYPMITTTTTTTTTTLPSPPPSVLHSNFSQPKPSIHVHVEVPKSDKQRSLIDKIARMVADNGRNVEQVAIMRVQARNGRKEKYNFLFDYDSPQAQYYRWRTAAERSTHDSSNSSSAAAGVGSGGGGRRSDEIKRGPGGRSRSKLGGKMLIPSDKALLMDKLTNLASTNRYVIKDLMVWCIDHTESSIEIVDMIIHEMKDERKDRLSKIPLLYLVSDILHNSGCSTKNGAWSYRTQLESKCAQILAMFRNNTTAQCENDDNSSSSIAVDKCCSVLNAWEQNAIFGPEYMSGLAATLMRTPDKDHDLSNIDTMTTQEERGRHFSQLERYCRNNGLLWEYPSSITDAEGKKQWLLLQIINERLYHNKNGGGGGGKMGGDDDDDDGIDGESVGSDDISIATSDYDEEDEEDIDGEALILPGDGIEEVIEEEKEERKAVDNNHTTTPTIIDDDDESLDGSPL
ncbi:U2 snRNP-associated SURP domain-containing protein [Perkinsus olseni]|uniref:U2 snRNP-associated SURP domain-containing protein n=1 Tax=Perkinsus olseni TaxID=32597 RepID=A0A7J6N2G7_PEROL|nr:U2 snRNP-associated SURP domain-containing protein [Perkinsus olseni]